VKAFELLAGTSMLMKSGVLRTNFLPANQVALWLLPGIAAVQDGDTTAKTIHRRIAPHPEPV